jgi:hypothetical protein
MVFSSAIEAGWIANLLSHTKEIRLPARWKQRYKHQKNRAIGGFSEKIRNQKSK